MINTTIEKQCTVTSSKRVHLSERTSSGVPFYCSKEIIEKVNGGMPSETDFISEEQYKIIKDRFGVPQPKDLLLTTRGTIGVPYLYKSNDKFYFADGNLTWLKDFKSTLSSKYLYYWFQTKEARKCLEAISKGTAQQALSIEGLKRLSIRIPDIKIQDQICEILSAYDDLIENNQKQIKLLEEAAQRLYKEWFVDLHFPGHEQTKIVDGVPEGWEEAEVGDVIGSIKRTTQIKTGDYHITGKIPVIDQSRDFIAGYTDDETSKIIMDDAVILFGDHTRILKYITFPFAKGADGTQVIVSNNENLPQVLFYWHLKNINLSNYHYARHFKYLKQHKIVVPIKAVSSEFASRVNPIMKQIQTLRDAIHCTSLARDYLLPKLMNGEIEI